MAEQRPIEPLPAAVPALVQEALVVQADRDVQQVNPAPQVEQAVVNPAPLVEQAVEVYI